MRAAVLLPLALATACRPSPPVDLGPLELPEALGEDFSATLDRHREAFAEAVATDHDRLLPFSEPLGGLLLAVARDGELLWSEGYGWADAAAERRVDADDVFRVGSITKTFTALTVHRLAEAGALDLDDLLVDTVPELGDVDDARGDPTAITWRHVLSHRSGLPREFLPGNQSRGDFDDWEALLLDGLATVAMEGEPDAAYSYSNAAYALMGLAAARVAGTSYAELLEAEVLAPLELDDTHLNPEGETGPPLAVGYGNAGNPAISSTAAPREAHERPAYKVPAGRVYSTARDLARLAFALMPERGGPALLSEETHLAMREQVSFETEGWWFGLGLNPAEKPSGEGLLFGHSGTVPGYRASFSYDPPTGLTVIALRNYRDGEMDLFDEVRDMADDLSSTLEP